MKGVDTNILVRYILQDDPRQSQLATDFIENECSVEAPVFINGIVLCELVWVLESAYEYPKKSIANVIEKILRIRQFHIHEPEIAWKALHGYSSSGGADFSDHYIANLNMQYGCDYTVTFDKKAARAVGFHHLVSQ